MPPLRRWIQFISSAGITVGLGVLFVKYGTPNDDQFLQKLSPELKARYLKEKDIRERADLIMQQKIKDSRDKPAWLQGAGAMRSLDREIVDQARKSIEEEEQNEYLESERARLKALADKESGMR